MLERSSTRYQVLLYVTDMLVTLASLRLAAEARLALPFGKSLSEPGGTVTLFIYVITFAIWSFVLVSSSAYDPRRILRRLEEAQTLIVAVASATLILAGFLFLTYRGLSRLLFAYFFLFDLALLMVSRLATRLLFKITREQRSAVTRVLIIGDNKVAHTVGRRVSQRGWMGLQLVGYVSEGRHVAAEAEEALALHNGPATALVTEEDNGKQEPDAPLLGALCDAPALVQQLAIDEVIIALPLRAHDELANLVSLLQELPVNIKVVPDFFDLVFLRATIEDFGGMPLVGLKEPVMSGFHRFTKRMLDVALSGAILITLSPLMLLLAVLIRLDSRGPVIFRQQRVGENGQLFWMYKFRTMIDGAEEQQSSLMMHDEDGNIVFRKAPNDPRLTRLGRTLRRFSLDETPQFFNVLRGDMSLVGPRPELPVIVQTYQPWQRKRFSVPPGMTGWWQIRGRSQHPMHLRTEDDLYYIQNYSLLLDLHIMWKTIGAVISGRGAY